MHSVHAIHLGTQLSTSVINLLMQC